MACGCRRSKHGQTGGFAELPHEIRPGESCAFCAEKHLAVAYESVVHDSRHLSRVIGELELARRHTAVEFSELSHTVAELEWLACVRDRTALLQGFGHAQELAADTVSSQDPDLVSHEDAGDYLEEPAELTADNPLIGEVHLCAAWRLAFEVGYMVPNRLMIIGDLALAREHLVRHSADIQNGLRDLRHRVQTIRYADLNVEWPMLAELTSRLVERELPSLGTDVRNGLRTYLGLSAL